MAAEHPTPPDIRLEDKEQKVIDDEASK
jgi:hypothetical protein